MLAVNWIDLIVFLLFGISSILLFKRYLSRRSLVHLYFGTASVFVVMTYLFTAFKIPIDINITEWGKLISITTYISGLLALVRESKPVFARFPIHLTALPFVSILVFPLVMDTLVIRDLVNAIYQGGALIVTILVFTLNNARKTGRRYYIIGLTLVTISYLSYWLYFNKLNSEELMWIPEILLSIGIFITLFRFIGSKHQS